jgi:heptosyltransferase-2
MVGIENRPSTMRVAVFCPGWVGDAVMATPALRALRRHFGDAHLIGVLKPYVAGVLEGGAWFDETLFLDRRGPYGQRWPAVVARLRRKRPDLAVLLPNSFRTALVAWLGGCRRRVGYARHGRGWLLTDALHPPRDPRGRLVPSPALDSYNRLAGHVGCPALSNRMVLFTTALDEHAADAAWHQAGFGRHSEVVCLNPGAAFGAAKHWPAESFAELAQRLVDRRGSGVLVLCGPGEQNLARQIAVLAGRPGVHTLAEQPLSLGLTKACVRRADLLITTDSGPRHLAAAFDRPVVTLFGPTHIAWTETYHPRAVHLQKQVPCGPCQLRVCPLDHRCMKQLTPAEVFAAAEQLLARQSLPPSQRERKAS